MEAVLGLLVISAGVSHCLETSCDARQNGCQCYGALGGTVYLQLVTDATIYDELSFYKGSTGAETEILRMKKDIWVIRDTRIKDRVHFFINNGTFRLNNTRSTDSGEYRLETFNSEGKSSGIRGLKLFIEAPVSSPQLSSECLSHGEMRVSCSSEGDGPQYSWNLDGQTLRDTEASADDETNTITLKKGLSGDLTCTVRNHISSDTVSSRISHCPGLIYVNCTLSNGTKVSEWVNTIGNTLCIESTTVATVTESPISKTSTGLETSCDARQNGCQCYGALGGTVYLQLVTDATIYDELSFYKGSTGAETEILRMKKDIWVIRDTRIKDRVHFFINNGTFRLNNTRSTDSGEYRLETFNSEGKSSGIRGLKLFIEAPVSSPQLSSECLSHGEMRVSCSSEGDGPQYSWNLDGQTLRDTEASADDETNTITLKKGLSGDLTCTVRNHISSDTVSSRISHCPGLIYVNCTLSNGTKVSEWVNTIGNTLCIESTTVATVTESPISKTSTGSGFNVFVYFQLAEVFILLTICLGSYWFYKKKTCPQEQDDGQ